ncbi:MAG: hypothetical protein L0H94_11740, partial [Nitrospira sp.]|nr:hypothetical protein [Nitrospira sp.]
MTGQPSPLPLAYEHQVTHDQQRPDDFAGAAATTLLTALLVVILGTAAIDPSRLLLLFIPGSFLLAAHGLGLLLERSTKPWAAGLPTHLPILTLTARLGM